jgi:hypothetical protein
VLRWANHCKDTVDAVARWHIMRARVRKMQRLL